MIYRNGWLVVEISSSVLYGNTHKKKLLKSIASEIWEGVSLGCGGDANYSMGSSSCIQLPCSV